MTTKQPVIPLAILLAWPMIAEAERTRQRLICAYTLYWEARSEGEFGLALVASVIANRAKQSGECAASVCLKPKQFSCWNALSNPVKWIEDHAAPFDAEWFSCLDIAELLTSGRFTPVTSATHYYRVGTFPKWARVMQRCTEYGRHVFVK